MQSASQASAFYREAAQGGLVWTVRDANGFPAPVNSDGQRAQPFWSSRARAECVIRSVAAYQGFTPVEIELEAFLNRWVPGLAQDGILIGVNWSGANATGYDIAPTQVAESISHFLRVGP
jgi:hypothetical protein